MNQPAKQPFSDTIWDERETWSRDRIESFQLDALKRQLQRVGERSVHYKRVFAEAPRTRPVLSSKSAQRQPTAR